MTLKILNLYAGIGGNRKLWTGDIEVTAIENNESIAKIYQDFFPNDKVIVTDAHQYLLEHYKEFDFIWSSPPCPSHSRMRQLKNNCEECEKKYPDMKLYEEIIFLDCFYKGKWVVENVISYYEPLIKPQVSNNHYFWCNFVIPKYKNEDRDIRTQSGLKTKEDYNNISLSHLELPERFKIQVLNNCVKPELALDIFKMAFKEKQEVLP
jgi:DNA (cytosine-5)-methyltransferase 1